MKRRAALLRFRGLESQSGRWAQWPALRRHIVGTAAGVLRPRRGSEAFADFQNPLPVFVGEGHIEPGVGVMDAHEERGFAIVGLDSFLVWMPLRLRAAQKARSERSVSFG